MSTLTSQTSLASRGTRCETCTIISWYSSIPGRRVSDLVYPSGRGGVECK